MNERSSNRSIQVTLGKFKNDQQIPTAQVIKRAMDVITGLEAPETPEEREYAPKKNAANKEMIINDKLLDARFIMAASEIQRCVGRIATNDGGYGTGFRISNQLIITCKHVLEDCREGCIQFHMYDPHLQGLPGNSGPQSVKQFPLDSETLYYENEELDFAVIAISIESQDVGIISSVQTAKCLTGKHMNIFSHPNGSAMRVSLRQNVAVDEPQKKKMITVDIISLKLEALSAEPHIIIHEADTEAGSSGAPIFNDRWQLVAIHQGYTAEKRGLSEDQFVGNYGTLIGYILEDMYSKPGETLTDFEKKLLNKVHDLGIPFENAKCTKNFKEAS